ncbi:MAG: AI-2E family transporter [Alphaproteobacteria bacterium]|nr:AI-2E family transporter [Alphaproteobacteria bacterium]
MQKFDSEKIPTASLVLMIGALIAVLPLGLLSALVSGLLVYNIIVFGAKSLCRNGVLPSNKIAKMVLFVTITVVVISLLIAGGVWFVSFISDGQESIVGLIKQMADVVASARKSLPGWIQDALPSNLEDWQTGIHEWLLSNARYLSVFGRDAGMFLVHVIFGMVIGGLAAMQSSDGFTPGPLTEALRTRANCLCLAFRRIIFSQIRISALNTFLTFIFLTIVMPAIGFRLPLIKTMVLVTFIVGLLPIIGNIISNTIIFLIALGVSAGAAVSALVFLILIHKLEYFVNAKIIGTRISAHAWEVLTAMLVMDAAFGLPGVVAAPIYYAYIKNELAERKLI